MSDKYVPKNVRTVRAHRWLPADAGPVIDMLAFLEEVASFGGMEVVQDEVALDVPELSGWIRPGDWVVLEDGVLKAMTDSLFADEYRKASDADA